ncbi:DUF4168 domain-containing protein [Parasphingopyxis marina]|uniref:DUF4168 domain-containing protein n=1 Tax=Parasphingopyxis marina TaxID=2761622 RepID=A0A842I1M9_9SPHN|nr:DUF4168 domain-containing protein [Parasphingopyxis marina]MBC2778120.1 DUF4168 domain-containing protein [Parasphingopyxis marina]
MSMIKTAAGLAAASLFSMTAASAQTAEPAAPAAAAEAAADATVTPPTAEEISQFAEAYIAIGNIQTAAQEATQQATPEDRSAVAQQMQQQMAAAVAAAGLTPARFNAIAEASQSDPELTAQIQQELQASQGG